MRKQKKYSDSTKTQIHLAVYQWDWYLFELVIEVPTFKMDATFQFIRIAIKKK